MIVGLVGRSIDKFGTVCTHGAGKDTVGDMLVETHGFTKMAFADPLKRISQHVFQLSDGQLWGESRLRDLPDDRYKNDEGDMLKPRNAVNTLGDWGRSHDSDIWVDLGISNAKRLLRGGYKYTAKHGLIEPPDNIRRDREYVPPLPPHGVVFTDILYWNELSRLKEFGGKIILIQRDVPRIDPALTTHQSEKDMTGIPLESDIWDEVIFNTAGIQGLRRQVMQAIGTLRGVATIAQ